MVYRSDFGPPGSRFAATISAIVPASIASGMTGTLGVLIMMTYNALAGGHSLPSTVGQVLATISGYATFFALGSIAGSVLVGICLLLFGLPVAMLLGKNIRHPGGLAAAIVTGLAATLFVGDVLWSGPISSGTFDGWGILPFFACFALPAIWSYRRYVIAMLDERSA